MMIDKPHSACHLCKNLLFLLCNILIDNDDYYKSLLNFIQRIIEKRSCLYLKINSTCNTLYSFSKTEPMRKLIYKLYIGSYNNKLHAYVHVPSHCFKIIKNSVSIKKIVCFKKRQGEIWYCHIIGLKW